MITPQDLRMEKSYKYLKKRFKLNKYKLAPDYPASLLWLSHGSMCFFLKRLVLEWANLALRLHHESRRARLRWYTKVMILAVETNGAGYKSEIFWTQRKGIRGFGEIRLRIWLSTQFSAEERDSVRENNQNNTYRSLMSVSVCARY